MSGKSIVRRNRNGEFIFGKTGAYIKQAHKPDSVMDRGLIAVLVTLLCAAVDTVFFINLFKMISYDNKLMLAFEVIGLVIGFDLVPAMAGILLRRIRQGLSHEKFVFWVCLGVFGLSLAVNVALRCMTVSMLIPQTATVSGLFAETAEGSVNTDALSAYALTVFGCVVPLITSLASFSFSYIGSNPLKKKQQKYETLLAEKVDEIRRLKAYEAEYDSDLEFAEHLLSDDEASYIEAMKAQREKTLSYCRHVRQRLMEHLANPTSTNALSAEDGERILMRLDRELSAQYPELIDKNSTTADNNTDNNIEAA